MQICRCWLTWDNHLHLTALLFHTTTSSYNCKKVARLDWKSRNQSLSLQNRRAWNQTFRWWSSTSAGPHWSGVTSTTDAKWTGGAGKRPTLSFVLVYNHSQTQFHVWVVKTGSAPRHHHMDPSSNLNHSERRFANRRGSKARRAIRRMNKAVRRGQQQRRRTEGVKWHSAHLVSSMMHQAFKRQFVTYRVLLAESKPDTQDAAREGVKRATAGGGAPTVLLLHQRDTGDTSQSQHRLHPLCLKGKKTTWIWASVLLLKWKIL